MSLVLRKNVQHIYTRHPPTSRINVSKQSLKPKLYRARLITISVLKQQKSCSVWLILSFFAGDVMMVLLFCNHRINSVLRTHKAPQHFLKLFIGYTSYQVWYSWINDAFDSDFLNRRSSHYTIGQPTISQKNVGPHTSFALHINISRSDRTVSNWYSIIDFTHILYPICIRHQNWYTLILNKIFQL